MVEVKDHESGMVDSCPIIKAEGDAVADPGFPRGGGANSPGGANIRFYQILPKNCMKLEKFGPPG